MSTESTEGPLVSKIILFTIFILDELFVFLVNRIIGQMHILVVFINFGSVGLTCKSSQAFLEHIDSQRFIACDQNVNSQIKLVAVYQERVCHISGNNR